IPPLLKERGLVGQSRSATKAIARMKREDYRLAAPDEHLLREALDKIRLLYRDAYEWNPPTPELASPQATRFMRQYVKSWITAWDMQRLYGQKSEVKIGSVASDYTESGSLERSPDADEAEG
ncbi:MAG: hypothetical protein ACREFZ_05685, partial [Acetobacteraceae bacterium]